MLASDVVTAKMLTRVNTAQSSFLRCGGETGEVRVTPAKDSEVTSNVNALPK
jgi:hypothetical protein